MKASEAALLIAEEMDQRLHWNHGHIENKVYLALNEAFGRLAFLLEQEDDNA